MFDNYQELYELLSMTELAHRTVPALLPFRDLAGSEIPDDVNVILRHFCVITWFYSE